MGRDLGEKIFEAFYLTMTGVGAYFGWLLGGFDGFLYALITFVALDYITGVMLAFVEKKLSSQIGFRGVFKKVLIFIMVAIGQAIDSKIIQSGSTIRTAVIFFYLSNEGISILENTGKMGLPLPEKLKKALEQLNKEEKKDE